MEHKMCTAKDVIDIYGIDVKDGKRSTRLEDDRNKLIELITSIRGIKDEEDDYDMISLEEICISNKDLLDDYNWAMDYDDSNDDNSDDDELTEDELFKLRQLETVKNMVEGEHISSLEKLNNLIEVIFVYNNDDMNSPLYKGRIEEIYEIWNRRYGIGDNN
jgi:hypothetical protein